MANGGYSSGGVARWSPPLQKRSGREKCSSRAREGEGSPHTLLSFPLKKITRKNLQTLFTGLVAPWVPHALSSPPKKELLLFPEPIEPVTFSGTAPFYSRSVRHRHAGSIGKKRRKRTNSEGIQVRPRFAIAPGSGVWLSLAGFLGRG